MSTMPDKWRQVVAEAFRKNWSFGDAIFQAKIPINPECIAVAREFWRGLTTAEQECKD